MAGLLDALFGGGQPGKIRRGADGQNYQLAETTGMAGATGDQGWIPTSMSPGSGGMRNRLRDLGPILMMMDPLGRNTAAAAAIMKMRGDEREEAKTAQAQNQTLQWLQGEGVDPGTAQYLVSDPDALRGWFGERSKGNEPDWKIQRIINENGQEQDFMVDMKDPTRRQALGGEKTGLLTPAELAQKKEIAGAGKSSINIDNAKLTEQQSKDIGFYSRGKYALSDLSSLDNQLTSPGGYLASKGGVVGNYFQDPQYQLAEGAARDFLAIILRKDTGAAVTPQEFDMYGKIYLPWPGDDKKTVEAKRSRRERALMGLRRGLGTASPLADDIDTQFEEETKAPQAPAETSGELKPGVTDSGYRFKGGDPGDPNNWEKVR